MNLKQALACHEHCLDGLNEDTLRACAKTLGDALLRQQKAFDELCQLWGPVDTYARRGAELGESVVARALALMERAEAAEAELAKLREQEPVGYVFSDWRGATTVSATKDNHFSVPLYAAPIPAPAVPAPEIPDGGDFNGTTPHMIQCIEALVSMSDHGVLAPHGLCSHARTLLLASANRLRQHPAPSVPEEWREVLARLLDAFDCSEAGFPQHAEIRFAVRDEARALLQSIVPKSPEVSHD